jgi:hypothetical protein
MTNVLGHGMDGQGFESRQGQKTVIFSKRSNQLSGIYNNQFSGYAGTFLEGKIKRSVRMIIPI